MLGSHIGKIELQNCIFNASGARCTYANELKDLSHSSAGAVLTKSCTLEFREGNPGIRYWDDGKTMSLNSNGLHNMGYQYYVDVAPEISQKKPYILSVAGLDCTEKVNILNRFSLLSDEQREKVSAIELNVSCPNINTKVIGYNILSLEDLLAYIYDFAELDIPLGLKLPPYFDLKQIEEVSDSLKNFPALQFVTCINSIPNGFMIDLDTESAVIQPNSGYGGLGGPSVLPVALANVHHFYRSLPTSTSVIGCGGVKNGADAFRHILAGASAVQVGTQLMIEGTKCLDRITSELSDLMEKKGYESVTSCQGRASAPLYL